MCRTKSETKIPNATDDETNETVYTEKEINDVFMKFAKTQCNIPRGDKRYGLRKLANCRRKKKSRDELAEFVLNITREDIMEIRSKLTNGKAQGMDKIPPEFLKYGGEIGVVDEIDICLEYIFQMCIELCTVPDYWRTGIVSLLFKGGPDLGDPGGHRPITLLPTIGKIMTKIMSKKIMEYCERNKLLAKGQNGFRSRRSCIQHIFTLVETCQKIHDECESDAKLFFLDLRKCFDRVCREHILEALEEHLICEKTRKLIRSLMNKTKCLIKTNKTISEPIETTRGVPQGCCLSPCTFVIFADIILRELDAMNLAYKIGENDETAVLMYADDLVIICDNEISLQRMIDRCAEIMQAIEMEANVAKCAIMDMKLWDDRQTNFEFIWRGSGRDDPVPLKQEYKYLGGYFDNKLSWEKHVSNVTRKAYHAFSKLRPYLCNRIIPVNMRIQAFNSLITPLFCYASECWAESGCDQTRKLSDIYNKMMKDCVGCFRGCHSETIHALSDLQSLEWWFRYFKMIFRYRCNDKTIGSLHYDLLDDVITYESDTRFGHWLATQDDDIEVSMERGEIIGMMRKSIWTNTKKH